MATFEELMEQFRNPGDTGLPENHLDALQDAYHQDVSVRDAAVTDRENQITEKENALAERDKEINRLKATNYDLLMAAPKAGKPAEDNKPDGDVEKRGVDSLFE